MDTNSANDHNSWINPQKLLRINDVVALTTLSRSCLNLWVTQGRFPKPIALSSTVKVWRVSDVSDWIDEQFARTNDSDGEPEGGLVTVE